jgi:hypothetical protein
MDETGQLHMPAALPPRKHPRYPLKRTLDKPQSRSGRFGGNKNLLSLQVIQPRFFGCPVRSLVSDIKLKNVERELYEKSVIVMPFYQVTRLSIGHAGHTG